MREGYEAVDNSFDSWINSVATTELAMVEARTSLRCRHSELLKQVNENKKKIRKISAALNKRRYVYTGKTRHGIRLYAFEPLVTQVRKGGAYNLRTCTVLTRRKFEIVRPVFYIRLPPLCQGTGIFDLIPQLSVGATGDEVCTTSAEALIQLLARGFKFSRAVYTVRGRRLVSYSLRGFLVSPELEATVDDCRRKYGYKAAG